MKRTTKVWYCTITICLLLTIGSLRAQDIEITFAGSGDTTTVETVFVQNLRIDDNFQQEPWLTVNGSDVLHLVGVVGINDMNRLNNRNLKVYPNPTSENATLEFLSDLNQSISVELFDLTGKKVTGIQQNCTSGIHSFGVNNLSSGVYNVSIITENGIFATKLLSFGKSTGNPKIGYIGQVSNSQFNGSAKSATNIVEMQYNEGDRLFFKAVSGNYATVKTLVPTENSLQTFNFVAAADADGNNYSTVAIGTQIWFAENLKTTKYSDGSSIPLVTDGIEWKNLTTGAYCWYDNDEAANKEIFGALYNWYAIDSATNGGKALCPTGWHVPTHDDWGLLITYLDPNANLGGSPESSIVGDKLKSANPQIWESMAWGNNESGFTGHPGGYRHTMYDGHNGDFIIKGWYCYWWGSMDYGIVNEDGYIFDCASFIGLYDTPAVGRGFTSKVQGHSVRCIKDSMKEK